MTATTALTEVHTLKGYLVAQPTRNLKKDWKRKVTATTALTEVHILKDWKKEVTATTALTEVHTSKDT